jgi:hypothetical protein
MALICYLTHVHLDFGMRALLPAECERVADAAGALSRPES